MNSKYARISLYFLITSASKSNLKEKSIKKFNMVESLFTDIKKLSNEIEKMKFLDDEKTSNN